MAAFAVRLRAAVLTSLFLGGALGLPLTDAALFHLGQHDPCAGLTHVEPFGNAHHADRCALAQPMAVQREALGTQKAIRVAPPLVTRAGVPEGVRPHAANLAARQRSRAPPA